MVRLVGGFYKYAKRVYQFRLGEPVRICTVSEGSGKNAEKPLLPSMVF